MTQGILRSNGMTHRFGTKIAHRDNVPLSPIDKNPSSMPHSDVAFRHVPLPPGALPCQ